MTPDPLDTISTPKQAWDLMREDFALRHSLMIREMTDQFLDDVEEILSELRGTGRSGSTLQKRLELAIKHTDDDAKRFYQACCEVWKNQGRQECRSFFQAIVDYCLSPLFKKRRSSVIGRLRQIDGALCEPEQRDNALGRFIERSRSLQAEWDIKVEIESRKCEQLARRELETQIEHKLSTTISADAHRKIKVRPLSKVEERKRSVIFAALQGDFKGSKYCSFLDEKNLKIPLEWQGAGCPVKYFSAYKGPDWRKRIQDEKCRYRKKYDETSPGERERLIQGKSNSLHSSVTTKS